MQIGSGITFGSGLTLTPPPTAPAAPTIGTATATGSTTATVTFTAPSDNGGATITSYTATSSPGNITGTLSQSGSGTITVSGLSASTSYTFTVTATNSVGTSSASSASNSITTQSNVPSGIGQAYGGGYYAGSISTSGNGIADYYLVIAPVESGQSNSIQIKTTDTSTTGTSSDIDGPTNSANMNNSNNPAAQYCEGLTIGGYSDWYLPAKNELEICYFNLKPNYTTYNNGSSGINPNAVPPRSSNYVTGQFSAPVPTTTTASLFISGSGAQAFNPNGVYWSSTGSGGQSWCQVFSNGWQLADNKTQTYIARAVRRVPV